MKKKNIVILSDDGLQSNRVVAKLNQKGIMPALIITESRKQSINKRIKYRIKKYGFMPTFRWVFSAFGANLKRTGDFSMLKYGRKIKTEKLSNPEIIAAIKKLNPVLIINTVSSIIPEEILKLGQNGVFGLHPGILPEFVGLSSIEWQLYENQIPGYSIFKLEKKVDEGKVFDQDAVRPKKAEDFQTYRRRFINESLNAFADFVSQNANRLKDKPMDLPAVKSLNRGLIGPKEFKLAQKNLKNLAISPQKKPTFKFNKNIPFEKWAYKNFILYLGLSLKQSEKIIDWGIKTDRPIYIPKTKGDLDRPRLGYESGFPYLFLASNETSGYSVSQETISFNFDLISAIGWLLGGFEEYYAHKRDRFGRWEQTNSIVLKEGFTNEPVVNIWLGKISDFLKTKKIQTVPLWPKNKKYAVILTHDCDMPYYTIKKALPDLFKKILAGDLAATKFCLTKIAGAVIVWTKDGFRSKTGLAQTVNIEKKLGLRSTLYLSSLAPIKGYRVYNDNHYDITEAPLKKELFQAIGEDFEIGLHPSVLTAPHQKRYREQKEYIENHLNCSITSLRHHYWNVSRQDTADAFLAMSQTGIKFDSSLCFYHQPGFRRSVALPFEVFHPAKNKKIDLIEIPSTFMDNWVSRNRGHLLQEQLEMIKKVGGVAVLDWHINRFNNKYYAQEGEIYIRTIKRLIKQNDVWLTTVEELGSWWGKRTKNLLDS